MIDPGQALPGGQRFPDPPAITYDLSANLERNARRTAGLTTLFRIGGGVVAAIPAALLLAGPVDPNIGKGQTQLLELVFVVFGLAMIAMTFLKGESMARSVAVDANGVRFGMQRPPDWELRWDDPTAWINFSRGYEKGSPSETDQRGWVVSAKGLSTTVGRPVGRSILNAAIARGFRVVRYRTGAQPGQREFEFITLEAAASTPRVKRQPFPRGTTEVLVEPLP